MIGGALQENESTNVIGERTANTIVALRQRAQGGEQM